MTDKKRKPGGGRKLKYGEPLSRLVCYCPDSKIKELREIVKAKLKEYEPLTKNQTNYSLNLNPSIELTTK